MATDTLKPAEELARAAPAQWPNESTEYRAARTALLAEEIELRRHIQRVAAQRRALPPGGEIAQDYAFQGKDGPVKLSEMFGDHDTLILYSMMYGPDRKQGCPMCSAQLDAWDGEARHILKRAELCVVARSPIERILAYAKDRGWTGLTFYSDPSGDFTKDYVGDRDADAPAYTVFQKKNGKVRHFYSAEGGMEIADPGQDPHNAPDMNPLWILLDTTPEGRGESWYPKLDD
jgi:predicted dithiol-disulfide oxidoreductase (DUF899 family)